MDYQASLCSDCRVSQALVFAVVCPPSFCRSCRVWFCFGCHSCCCHNRELSPPLSDSSSNYSHCVISCEACQPDGAIVASLPRLNVKLDGVSTDLGEFDWLDCDPSAGTCSLPSLPIDQLIPKWAALPRRSPVNYVQVSYVVVDVLVCVPHACCVCSRLACTLCLRSPWQCYVASFC